MLQEGTAADGQVGRIQARVQILGNPWAAALPPNPSPRPGRSLHGSVQALESPAARHRPRPPENVRPAAADGKAPRGARRKRSGAEGGGGVHDFSTLYARTPAASATYVWMHVLISPEGIAAGIFAAASQASLSPKADESGARAACWERETSE